MNRLKIAYITTDFREDSRSYGEPVPRFVTGHESLFEGLAAFPDIEVHIISCYQQPVQSPKKLADNIWIHSLLVPKTGWLRTLYQGCIRATRRKLREIQPAIVHGHGTERDGAICAVFSGFPNVVTIQGNMAELARMNGARLGSYHWLTARLEDFLLPRTMGVFCNSAYTEQLVRPRAKQVWRVPHALRRVFLAPVPQRTFPRPSVFLIAGVISPRKRQLELLNVAEALHERGLIFEFRFIGQSGTDSYTAAFLKRIKPMASMGYARYLGQQPVGELVGRFDEAEAMIHFPSEEAFGNVVVEALARDLKFFGARVGGIVDIAENVPGTELFAVNDWAGLTDSLASWIKLGRPMPVDTASLMRERYAPEAIARTHLEIYREVLETPS